MNGRRVSWVTASALASILGTSLACQTFREYSSELTWKGFYYKNAEYPTNPLDERRMLEESPSFSTLQDCMKWGSSVVANNPSDGFECSYGCRFDDGYNAVICKDTTKMVYLNRFVR
jgi:hypothetical protein